MKHRILPFLLAVILGAGALTACSSGSDGATGDEAVNRVYPEGEGRYYEASEADVTAGQTTTVPGSTAAQTTTKPADTKATTATSPTTARTAVNPSVTSPQPTVQSNVPGDNVSGDNINPNIDNIQGDMASQVDAASVQSISLSANSLNIEIGESRTLTVSFNPSNASNKTITASIDNGNASVSVSGASVTVTGSKAGTCTLTVTSSNGHVATCDIIVKHGEASVTDSTVLAHGSLVTVNNAERWTAEVIKHLKSLGMQHDSTLQSVNGNFSLLTDGLDNMSYNDVATKFDSDAEDKVLSMGIDLSSSKFNCICKAQDNGEFAIIVVII